MNTNENYFNLVARIIESSIVDNIARRKNYKNQIVISKTGTNLKRKVNIKFADSKLIKLFADCSNNFEEGKLKKSIIEANQPME